MSPDEQVYTAGAKCLRQGGLHALRDMAEEFAEETTLQAYPSPLRWSWLALVALFLPISELTVQILAWAMVGPLVLFAFDVPVAALWAAASPLAFILGRRRLQDVPVALATLLGVWAATSHSPWLLGAALLMLLLKEGAVFALPALLAASVVSGGDPSFASIELGAALIAYFAVQALVLGPRRLVAILGVLRRGHATAYAAEHQRGAPHRLLVDMLMASPLACIYAVVGAHDQPAPAAAALVLVAAHALAPVRNVRFVLAADILLRVVGASAMRVPMVELPLALLIDLYVARKLRAVYDPVSFALSQALGMQPMPSK